MRYQCDALDSNSIFAKGGIFPIALHKHQVRPSYCGLPACFLATLLFTVSQKQSLESCNQQHPYRKRVHTAAIALSWQRALFSRCEDQGPQHLLHLGACTARRSQTDKHTLRTLEFSYTAQSRSQHP